MIRRHMIRSATATVVAALLCSAGSLPMVQADAAAAVSLRYHFKAGEVLAYSMKTAETVTTKIAGQPADTVSSTVLYQSRYVIHSLDSAGNATLSIEFDPGKATDVHNGKTTHRTIPADQLSSPASACIQENDGTQYCVYRGGYGLNDVGQVSLVPVAVPGTWTSIIDNTWLANAKPVSLTNRLKNVTSSRFGRVANVTTSMQTTGKSALDSGGKHYALTVHVRESGTWGIGVESGVFLNERLQQTITASGTVTDTTGVHALTRNESTDTTMQLVSTRSGTVQPLGKPYTTKTFTPAGSGFHLDYPSSWTAEDSVGGAYHIVSPDKTGLILGSKSATGGDVTNPAYVSRFLRSLGTPVGTIVNTVRTINGQQYGIADAVLRLSGQSLEAQCEVRVRADGKGSSVLAGVVSLGPPGVSTRPPDLAHEYEQVQKSLDSVQMTGSQV